METTLLEKQALKGGEFLIRETHADEIFIPENFSEEQRMMADACQAFIESEIWPNIERIDSLEEGLMSKIVEKAGELGLLAVTVPEEYGGLGMSFNTSMLMADIIGAAGSFSTTFGAHTGIGTLPIQYYGNDAQKEKYLPRLGSGEWKASYCLTEPDAGSDANAGKTKAVLNEAGTHYLISGQKMWISNAGFADLFIVFAKIGNDKNLTAFIVEKGYEGITLGEEEKKLGIKGSSTRQVFFNETPVPVENMLSERENGFKIALNILNIGRIKLGVGVVGGCKHVTELSTQYANERKQFKQPISNFGAIQYKIAEMALRTYALESASYRAGQDIEHCIEMLKADGLTKENAILKGVEQFAIEASIIKVFGSEVLDYVVDEGVQIYGGMGFSADAPMERAYRDSRIGRIYEGTNEINRMLLVSMILKRAMKGELAIMDAAKEVANELLSIPDFSEPDNSLFAEEKEAVKNMKKAILLVAGKAVQDLKDSLKDEQEILMNVADMIIETYICESAILRAEKLASLKGEESAALFINMARVNVYEAIEKVAAAGREAIVSFAEEGEIKMLMMGLKRFTKPLLTNVKKLRREIASVAIEKNGFPY